MKACSAAFAPSACHANGADRANIAIPAHIAFLAHIAVPARVAHPAHFARFARVAHPTHFARFAPVALFAHVALSSATRHTRASRPFVLLTHLAVSANSVRAAHTPTVGAAAPADGLQGRESSAAHRASSTSSLSPPPTGHRLFTSDKRPCITPLVTAFTTSRTGIVHLKRTHLHQLVRTAFLRHEKANLVSAMWRLVADRRQRPGLARMRGPASHGALLGRLPLSPARALCGTAGGQVRVLTTHWHRTSAARRARRERGW